jgi:Anti-sigma factor NepR
MEPNALGIRLVPCKFAGLETSVWEAMAQNKDAPNLRAQIDENLKRVYEEALEEKVPDRFKELLEQLRQKEARK